MKDYPTLTNSASGYGTPKEKCNGILQSLGRPHVDSFNYMIKEGLNDSITKMNVVKFSLPNGDLISLFVKNAQISSPYAPFDSLSVKNKKIYPSECRQRAVDYKGSLQVTIGWMVNGIERAEIIRDFGEIPIMLKSSLCHLNNLSPKELIANGEHENEWGGQFISKGKEKLIRMLIMTRKNFPMALKRSTWKDRGEHFSDLGIMMRCVQSDQTSKNNVLHLLTNGTAKLMFNVDRILFFIPVILVMKCIVNYTDEYIYKQLLKGYEGDQYYEACIQNMLRDIHNEGLHNHQQCKEYIGSVFRSRLRKKFDWATNTEITDILMNASVLIHLEDNSDKFNMLVLMIQKLFQAAQDKIKLEGNDSVMMQELLLGGHLYQKILKEKLETALDLVKDNILKLPDFTSELSYSQVNEAVKRSNSVGKQLEHFLATGNINTRSGLGLMQTTGLAIIAENINRTRYMSHFKSVHRGSFFVEMRTTEARQLLPEAWGFICPVHTPDGSPCGLLNHLTVNCVVSPSPKKELVNNIPQILVELGMIAINSILSESTIDKYIVILEGRLIGYIKHSDAPNIVGKLRMLKIDGKKVPKMMEIALVPQKKKGQIPGLYLFVGAARMMRPVFNLSVGKLELIGTFEQVYMEICITPEEAYKGLTTHMEPSKTAFLSNLANLIPMPDCNQSPRNMYQCQMAKQTMGTPCHNWQLQSENKLYRLQTPNAPLFRPVHHDNIELDDFAMGTNAIVAVISYTGYDMEDAMIINKSANERGLAHGCIYKSEFIELEDDSYFCRNPHNHDLVKTLDSDGLPHPGTRLEKDDIFYSFYDTSTGKYVAVRFRNSETCIVDNVKLCGNFEINTQKVACITYRIQRNPSVGDKFASRAGQKGICSQKWPAEDLPFTESGLIPDIVFNPHGFPSRMTIAMMIEIMAGKSAALHGLVHDATPFRFTEKDTAIDYFGKLLEAGGYNYYGTERMYSGIDGREMKADIFFGIVHYQRLRHMVSDKWQVRSTGPIDSITHQPIKGRSRGGGVRFGEMERDCLISHGTSFLLQDRLFHCSDKVTTMVCKKCGSMVGPIDYTLKVDTPNIQTCRICDDDKNIDYVEIPYVFKFLVAQLSAVNINVKMNFKNI